MSAQPQYPRLARPSGRLTRGRSLDSGEADTGQVLSRREKAFRAIEGHPSSLLTINPWIPLLDLDPSIVALVAAGGLALLVETNDPTDLDDSETLALLWDDDVLATSPQAVEEGDRALFIVPDVHGTRLTIWGTDRLQIRVVEARTAAAAAELRAGEQERRRQNDSKTPKDPVTTFIEKLGDAYTTVGVVGVVVAGVVLYFMFKDKV